MEQSRRTKYDKACTEFQTLQHILLTSPLFNDLRREIWQGEGARQERMDMKELLNVPAKARKAAHFMIQTRLLSQRVTDINQLEI
ncbi:hypothetical protein ACJ73_09489 [Blastomyces percursus]|uniref:Uncharacterized protein n=1 Tax=Blastomyces percursus TaxID=1658174 RepID=A0A1J9Q963_9EURO|nr:hypothetical protein ACJ73_09489 [Blastomyces percursus]